MAFVVTVMFGINAINPVWTNKHLLIMGALYLALLIFSYIIMTGVYDAINIQKRTMVSIITNVLDEKGIEYEIVDNSLVLADYGREEINYKGFSDSCGINFRGIMKLPFYNDVKDEFISRVLVNKEKAFPFTGALVVVIGILLILIGLVVEFN
jgi:hypothetical protein